MDRQKPKRRVTPKRVVGAGAVLAVAALVAWAVWGRAPEQTLRVHADRLAVATVVDEPFQEYLAVTGTVQPLRTVFLDAIVGGQVVRRLVDEGDTVRAGQALFTLRNDDLALTVLGSESQLEEQAAAMRQNRLALDQNRLSLEQQLAEQDYNITRLEREAARLDRLEAGGAVATQEGERVRDELAYARRRRALALEGHRADSAQRQAQLRDMDASLARLRENLDLVRGTRQGLVVRAPVDGQFSALEAEVGELKGRGARLGQIDVLDEVKVRVPIDEHYLTRVAPGQTAVASVGGADYPLRVRTVYPEVAGGRFEVEMVFTEAAPPDTRRGQSLRIRLQLGDPERALLLPRGGFYGDTGGQWVFVLASDGQTALRRPVELGRQNPRHFEVLGGLRRGERAVVSSYAAFGDAERLILE